MIFIIDKSGIKDDEVKRILYSVYKTFEVNEIISNDDSRSHFSIIVKSDVTDYNFKKSIQNTLLEKLETEYKAHVEIL